MATASYLATRKTYARPQAMIFANGYTTDGGKYVPEGTEFTDFIVLSDHNRSEISMSPQRIENKKRMINGRMRSVWLTDKLEISTSWKNLPSRAAAQGLVVESDIVKPAMDGPKRGDLFVVDKGAATSDLVKWHKEHSSAFWVLVSFDDPHELASYNKITEYTVAIECFFKDFEYTLSKRGPRNDLWDVNLSLEEV